MNVRGNNALKVNLVIDLFYIPRLRSFFFFFFQLCCHFPLSFSSSIYLFSHLFMKHNMKSYYPNWFLVKLKLFGRFKLVLLSTGSEITSIDVYHLKQ